MIRKADRFPSSSTTVGLGRSFAWNQWARVNNVVDDNGKVVMSSTEALARAELLKGNDNALDSRSCGMAPDPGTTFELDLESVA